MTSQSSVSNILFITVFVIYVTDSVDKNHYTMDRTGNKEIKMSELIQNNNDKQESLKNIVRNLSEGSDIKAVQKEFKKIIKDVSPEEIAAMEQSLIDSGVPVEHVQSLCDVHVKVFEDTLSKQKTGRALPGHPVHTFKEENKALQKRIKVLKRASSKASKGTDPDLFVKAFEDLKKIEIHYARKENQLFPFLETVNFTGPSRVMWGKHNEIRDMIKEIDSMIKKQDFSGLKQKVKKLSRALSGMIFMEEKILYPTALRKLPEQSWIQIRKGEKEIGYAWVSPGNLWDPDIIKTGEKSEFEKFLENAEKKKVSGEKTDTIPLQVGELNLKQLNLMLNNIPLDISFVDENDEVKYYSGGKERLFPRSPGIIGRKVQNCHPPKSAHIVQKIVESFKNREKEYAEFYFQMKDRFIHIRYFPVYDEEQVYRGVLEVSQDITGIKKLEGQKKLLDW